jgi:hypothetical protein
VAIKALPWPVGLAMTPISLNWLLAGCTAWVFGSAASPKALAVWAWVAWVAAVGAKAIAVCCVGHINTQKTMLAAASAQTKPVTQGITKLREGLC